MAIEFSCPACRGTLRVEDSSAGRLIRCGGCMTTLRVPEAAAESAAPPEAQIPPRPEPEPYPPPDDSLFPRRADDDDYDRPRPRRRRRRRPPPPSGRGAVFWILTIFGLIAVGSCACCGGVFLLLPDAKWRTHESKEGGFKVELPAAPKKELPIPGMKADPNMKVEGTMLWRRGEFYAVMYWDIPPAAARVETDKKLLDAAVKAMETDPEVRRVVRDVPITVSDFAGREVEYVATDGGTYIGRFVIADSRLYGVVGGGRFVHPGNANVRRFLDSFAVTDPKLLRAAKQRAREADRAPPRQWDD
jgi:hypothetical protein